MWQAFHTRVQLSQRANASFTHTPQVQLPCHHRPTGCAGHTSVTCSPSGCQTCRAASHHPPPPCPSAPRQRPASAVSLPAAPCEQNSDNCISGRDLLAQHIRQSDRAPSPASCFLFFLVLTSHHIVTYALLHLTGAHWISRMEGLYPHRRAATPCQRGWTLELPPGNRCHLGSFATTYCHINRLLPRSLLATLINFSPRFCWDSWMRLTIAPTPARKRQRAEAKNRPNSVYSSTLTIPLGPPCLEGD